MKHIFNSCWRVLQCQHMCISGIFLGSNYNTVFWSKLVWSSVIIIIPMVNSGCNYNIIPICIHILRLLSLSLNIDNIAAMNKWLNELFEHINRLNISNRALYPQTMTIYFIISFTIFLSFINRIIFNSLIFVIKFGFDLPFPITATQCLFNTRSCCNWIESAC